MVIRSFAMISITLMAAVSRPISLAISSTRREVNVLLITVHVPNQMDFRKRFGLHRRMLQLRQCSQMVNWLSLCYCYNSNLKLEGYQCSESLCQALSELIKFSHMKCVDWKIDQPRNIKHRFRRAALHAPHNVQL